jgi:hypothetical protein
MKVTGSVITSNTGRIKVFTNPSIAAAINADHTLPSCTESIRYGTASSAAALMTQVANNCQLIVCRLIILVTVVIRLVWPVYGNTNVTCLIRS